MRCCELKRGRQYDAVILDPPSYGHAPGGAHWKLDEQLSELMELCLELTAETRQFLLLTCHSGFLAHVQPLLDHVAARHSQLSRSGTIVGRELFLVSALGGRLHSGAALRRARYRRRPAR